jgi:hypothetical protein
MGSILEIGIRNQGGCLLREPSIAELAMERLVGTSVDGVARIVTAEHLQE